MSTHPAPHRGRAGGIEIAFALTGGVLAWGIQFCAGYAVASLACFDVGERAHAPLGPAQSPIAWISVACLVLALASTGMALALWRRTRAEVEGGHEELLEKGAGRTRFLALWGLLLGGGSAVTILVNTVGLLMVPPCAG